MKDPKQSFNLDELVDSLKSLSQQTDARAQIKSLLEETVSDPHIVASGMPEFEEDDVILFEDDSISIWHCRFKVGQNVPAHDHQMVATIAVYQGTEHNHMWVKEDNNKLKKKTEIDVKAGDVLQFGATAIHSVSCSGPVDSCAIHVYLGKLTTVDRSLFDIDNHLVMKFDDDNYYRLVQHKTGD